MSRSRSTLRTVLTAGFVAGTLDLLDAIVFFGLRSHVRAERVLQSVASGLLGRAAYSGGWTTALLGLLLHFGIAAAWAAVFIFTARFIPVMKQHAVAAGMVFGLIVYGVMHIIIVPASRAVPQPSHVPIVVFNAVCAIVLLVGLPIALVNRKLG